MKYIVTEKAHIRAMGSLTVLNILNVNRQSEIFARK